jgi:hypothetical protein
MFLLTQLLQRHGARIGRAARERPVAIERSRRGRQRVRAKRRQCVRGPQAVISRCNFYTTSQVSERSQTNKPSRIRNNNMELKKKSSPRTLVKKHSRGRVQHRRSARHPSSQVTMPKTTSRSRDDRSRRLPSRRTSCCAVQFINEQEKQKNVSVDESKKNKQKTPNLQNPTTLTGSF